MKRGRYKGIFNTPPQKHNSFTYYCTFRRWVMADVLVVSNFHRTTNINLTNVRIQACHFIPNKFHAFLPATWRRNGKLSGLRYSHNRGQEIGRGRTLIRRANVWKCNVDYNMLQNNFVEDKDVNVLLKIKTI